MLGEIIDRYPAIWQKIRQRTGAPANPKYIGEGGYGCAYDLGDGRVLKVSNDESEGYGGVTFKENPSPYVVKVHDVFMYIFPNNMERYFLVTEKLLPLTSDQAAFIRDCDEKAGNGFPHKVYERMEHFLTKAEARRYRNKMEWLKGLVQEFEIYNFNWNDFHGGNFMRKGRHMIQVVDLGHSCPNDMPPIPWL